MSPTIFFLSCICLLTEGKVAHGQQENGKSTRSEQAKNKVRHHKWWLIETTNNEEGEEYGVDYHTVAIVPLTTPVPTCAGKLIGYGPCPVGKYITVEQECEVAAHVLGYKFATMDTPRHRGPIIYLCNSFTLVCSMGTPWVLFW